MAVMSDGIRAGSDYRRPEENARLGTSRWVGRRLTALSSLKERAGVKRGWPAGLRRCGVCRAWRHGLTAGFPDWCRSRAAGGRVLDRAAARPPPAAPQASLTRRRRADNGLPGKAAGCGGYAVMGAPSAAVRRGRPAGCRHPFVTARPGWPGAHGAVRVRSGRGSITSLVRRRRRSGGHTFPRPRARPAGSGHAAGVMARRTCPSRRT